MITTDSKLFALKIDDEIPDCDFDIAAICLEKDINKSIEKVEHISAKTDKILMLCGVGNDEIDAVLLSEVANAVKKECIISFATEKNYKKIIPAIIENNHYIVLKTPIDINLAKELNILALDMGLNRDKIIMNTDIGALGYGYEYGYSMIEKIKLEKNDEYLNFPIISDAAIEVSKTKEAKSDKNLAKMLELSAVSGVLAAGANVCSLIYPDSVEILKGFV